MSHPPIIANRSIFDGLPITAILPSIRERLLACANTVIVAPPGAGKTIGVTLDLLHRSWLTQDRIILVQPRRLAVRNVASYMASLLNETIGLTVGYRTRLDTRVSRATKIEVVTEGVFLRQILSDPFLEGTAAVLFDEVHERALNSDLAIAFTRDIQRHFRNDLRLIAMSATLDVEATCQLLAAVPFQCPLRQYPVTTRYLPEDVKTLEALPQAMASAIRSSLSSESGDVLAFLPGVAEIRKVTDLLAGCPAEIRPLYSKLSLEQQQHALSGQGPRRVILSTAIAETSLTVPRISIVIDGGFRRDVAYDPSLGFGRLVTQRVSRANAAQRAGRAGRIGPGLSIRLWTQHSERGFALREPPEILHADLASFTLYTARWADLIGTPLQELPLIDRPNDGAMRAARSLLTQLGALDVDGHITALGRRMSAMGTHPRFAAMLCAAETPSQKAVATEICSLLEADPLPDLKEHNGSDASSGADITRWIERVFYASSSRKDAIYAAAQLYRKRLYIADNVRGDLAFIPHLVARGFPDCIAQMRGKRGRYVLAAGEIASLSANDPLAKSDFLIALRLHKPTVSAAKIVLALALDLAHLPDNLQALRREADDIFYDPTCHAVVARRRLWIDTLLIAEHPIPASGVKARALLVHAIKNDPASFLQWSDAARQFQHRALWAQRALALEITDFSDQALYATLEDWLTPHLGPITQISELREYDFLPLLEQRLDYAARAIIEKELPRYLDFPNGRLRIDYTTSTPSIAARAQSFFGIDRMPSLARGRVPLQFVMLSPAGRPQAITGDIGTFWKTGWLEMRRDMRGRYPKHSWPENPADVKNIKPTKRN